MTSADSRWRHLPTLWALALPVLVLGPALGHGFVLSYDMVWVPDLALRSDMLGFSPALPRAVPSDAVVAVLDEVVPGMLLQKVVLLGSLAVAGLGIARLVDGSVSARLVAVSVYVWNPFVAERLWIGHWPLLAGYAVLPWVARAASRFRQGRGSWAALAVWLPWGCLSPSAGLLTAVTALACGLGPRRPAPARGGWRTGAVLLASVGAANAPWLVAGALHAGTATSSDASVYALHGEGPLPPLLAGLTLGGIWNTEVVPASRDGLLAWVSLAGLVALAAAGARTWWRRARRGPGPGLVVCWGVGLTAALLPALLPGAVDQLAALVPGLGLVRDSARFLALCAPLVAVLAGTGAEVALRRVPHPGPRAALAGGLVLLPVMVLPDLAWGVGGALRPVEFPLGYAAARTALASAEESRPGDVVILPFTSYRAPAWNDHRKVLAPLGRVLTPNDVTSDELSVSGRVLAGEDPRGPRVRAALRRPTPQERSTALAALGIQYAAVDPGDPVLLAGRSLVAGPDVRVVELAATAVPRVVARRDRAVLAMAWTAWLGLILAAVAGLVRVRSRAAGRGGPLDTGDVARR